MAYWVSAGQKLRTSSPPLKNSQLEIWTFLKKKNHTPAPHLIDVSPSHKFDLWSNKYKSGQMEYADEAKTENEKVANL